MPFLVLYFLWTRQLMFQVYYWLNILIRDRSHLLLWHRLCCNLSCMLVLHMQPKKNCLNQFVQHLWIQYTEHRPLNAAAADDEAAECISLLGDENTFRLTRHSDQVDQVSIMSRLKLIIWMFSCHSESPACLQQSQLSDILAKPEQRN